MPKFYLFSYLIINYCPPATEGINDGVFPPGEPLPLESVVLDSHH
jgi:hypothetical protein